PQILDDRAVLGHHPGQNLGAADVDPDGVRHRLPASRPSASGAAASRGRAVRLHRPRVPGRAYSAAPTVPCSQRRAYSIAPLSPGRSAPPGSRAPPGPDRRPVRRPAAAAPPPAPAGTRPASPPPPPARAAP